MSRRLCTVPPVLVLLVAQFVVGCATMPYRFIPHDETGLVLQLQEGETQIERGTPNPLIDGFGHYFFSLPSKLVLLNWKVDNHDVSPELEASLAKLLTRWGQC